MSKIEEVLDIFEDFLMKEENRHNDITKMYFTLQLARQELEELLDYKFRYESINK